MSLFLEMVQKQLQFVYFNWKDARYITQDYIQLYVLSQKFSIFSRLQFGIVFQEWSKAVFNKNGLLTRENPLPVR